MRIGTNIPSLKTHNSLTRANFRIGKSTEKLSSGKKINSATDDAAGLAIGNKINLQVHGIEQASRNSSNGISVVQTAEGAMNAIHSMLQRVRELCVAAANDTNETEDRIKMQDEINQLLIEIDAIPLKTQYNKIKLLNGEAGRIVKPTNTTSKNIDFLEISPTTPFGFIDFAVTTQASKTIWQGTTSSPSPLNLAPFKDKNLNINGINIPINGDENIDSIFNKINETCEQTGFKATKSPLPDVIFESIESKYAGSQYKLQIAGDAPLLAALGIDVGNYTIGSDAVISIDTATPESALSQNVTYSSVGDIITIKDVNGTELKVDLNKASTGTNINVQMKQGPLVVQVGANKDMGMYMDIPKINCKMLGSEKINVMTANFATNSINIADESIKTVSKIRSRLGAYQNRLEYTISSLDNSEINARSSYSRIMDTDMASEMTNYSKDNIILQAATAILAQSNQRPQAVLQLLQ